jgi:hypothetical protein
MHFVLMQQQFHSEQEGVKPCLMSTIEGHFLHTFGWGARGNARLVAPICLAGGVLVNMASQFSSLVGTMIWPRHRRQQNQ